MSGELEELERDIARRNGDVAGTQAAIERKKLALAKVQGGLEKVQLELVQSETEIKNIQDNFREIHSRDLLEFEERIFTITAAPGELREKLAAARAGLKDLGAVNLMAPCVLMEAAFEDMKKRGWGKIVNVTTSGVFSGGGDGIAYNATKGGLESATRFLAKRYAKDGVTINALAPGPTLTAIMRSYIGEEEFERHYLPTMPIGRILTPEDFAKVVLFFCSPLSDAITGESVLADGGRARLNPA